MRGMRKPGGLRRRVRTAIVGATAVALCLTGASLTTSAAQAQSSNPYQRGPAPTERSIEASRGPFAVAQTTVSRLSATGFGGGTIYYPTDTSQGRFGGVAISPGFTALQSSIAWLGPRIASQGFIVFTIDTITTLDQPAQRGDQLLAALDYLVQRSPTAVRNRLDSSRLAVMGHSMGGGGTLEAAKKRPSLKAAIPLTGWNLDTIWNDLRVPTLVVGAQLDLIAPILTFSLPFYNTIPASTEKVYLELAGASHFAPNLPDTNIAKYSIAWLKRWVDNDTRYTQFLCPGPRFELAISNYMSSCPM